MSPSSSSTLVSSLQETRPDSRQRTAGHPSWLHTISHLHPKYGGVSAVVPQLDAAIAGTGRYNVHLAAFCSPGEEYSPAPAANVTVSHFALNGGQTSGQPDGVDLGSLVHSAAGVHIHGLWQQSTARTASLARKAGKPYVVSAHGMLESWALANKRWKKRLYLALVEGRNLRSAACLHALTRAEAGDYRRLNLRNPVAIIPNGVHVPAVRSDAAFLAQFPQLAGKQLVLFLGRIHFKKGLDILCQAWARVAPRWPSAQLVLAGPDFEATLPKIEALVQELKISERVTFTGMLAGESKWSALAAASFFVLPSYSEGLSVSILEAMGMGKPVLITENCNFPEAGDFGCGAVIKADASSLERALEEMLAKPASELAAMGDRGERLVQTRYSWEAIGRQMTDLYEWIQGGPKPTTFELDLWGGRE